MANRRKFLAGLGALASGSAAAVGTGAFTSVSADRSVAIDTAGDADAFLAIEKAEDIDGDTTPNAQEYVDEDGNGVLSLDFTDSATTSGSANGVNRNAETIFDNLLDITNNGSQDVELYVESPLLGENNGPLGVYAENSQGDDSDNSGLSSSNPVTLSPGSSATNIGVYVIKGETTSEIDISDGTLTFVAEKTGGNQD